jgi:hypothetical protein
VTNIIAGVEHHEIDGVAGRLGEIKQRDNFGLDGCIGPEGLGLTVAIGDGAGDLRNFVLRAPGNDHPMAFDSEPARERGAQPLLGTNSDNDSRALKRAH